MQLVSMTCKFSQRHLTCSSKPTPSGPPSVDAGRHPINLCLCYSVTRKEAERYALTYEERLEVLRKLREAGVLDAGQQEAGNGTASGYRQQ